MARRSQQALSEEGRLKVMTIERQPFAMALGGKLVGFSVELVEGGCQGTRNGIRNSRLRRRFRPCSSTSRRPMRTLPSPILRSRPSARTVLDFSQPMFDAGIQVMMRAEGRIEWAVSARCSIGKCSACCWLRAIVLFVVANLMWWFERRDQAYFQYPYGEGMWRSFWWALNLMVNGGFEERMPQTRNGRVFAVFLVIASLFLVSAFVAKITASLTVGELKSHIQGYRDLLQSPRWHDRGFDVSSIS